MTKETTDVVTSIKNQWWLKVNTKPFRIHALNGAVFPHIITAKYTVGEKEYKKRRWIRAGQPVPELNSYVHISYDENKPKNCKITNI